MQFPHWQVSNNNSLEVGGNEPQGLSQELICAWLRHVQAFTNGGPDRGTLVNSQVILAGTDRVAIDAVGVALLRHFGTAPEVSRGAIFEQEQIARAVQLSIGVSSPKQIELVTGDRESAEYAKQICAILDG